MAKSTLVRLADRNPVAMIPVVFLGVNRKRPSGGRSGRYKAVITKGLPRAYPSCCQAARPRKERSGQFSRGEGLNDFGLDNSSATLLGVSDGRGRSSPVFRVRWRCGQGLHVLDGSYLRRRLAFFFPPDSTTRDTSQTLADNACN